MAVKVKVGFLERFLLNLDNKLENYIGLITGLITLYRPAGTLPLLLWYNFSYSDTTTMTLLLLTILTTLNMDDNSNNDISYN
jgi:hypothetical protein